MIHIHEVNTNQKVCIFLMSFSNLRLDVSTLPNTRKKPCTQVQGFLLRDR